MTEVFEEFLKRFTYDRTCDPYELRIQANVLLLDLEYAALIEQGVITLYQAECMKRESLHAVLDYYRRILADTQ